MAITSLALSSAWAHPSASARRSSTLTSTSSRWPDTRWSSAVSDYARWDQYFGISRPMPCLSRGLITPSSGMVLPRPAQATFTAPRLTTFCSACSTNLRTSLLLQPVYHHPGQLTTAFTCCLVPPPLRCGLIATHSSSRTKLNANAATCSPRA
jgi:hypothetical protein